MSNEITSGAIVKPVACVDLLNTEETKLGVGFTEFKRRMGDVEGMLMTYNLESARERSAASMNKNTACGTKIGPTLVFFAAYVASECDPLPTGSQLVIVEFSFKFQNSTFHVKVEVATVTAISVFLTRFITNLASAVFFLKITNFFVKKNKRM